MRSINYLISKRYVERYNSSKTCPALKRPSLPIVISSTAFPSEPVHQTSSCLHGACRRASQYTRQAVYTRSTTGNVKLTRGGGRAIDYRSSRSPQSAEGPGGRRDVSGERWKRVRQWQRCTSKILHVGASLLQTRLLQDQIPGPCVGQSPSAVPSDELEFDRLTNL